MKTVIKSKKGTLLRSLSIAFAAVFLIETFPMYSLAEGNNNSSSSETGITSNETPNGGNPVIVAEDKDKRTENSKEFILSNGEKMVAMYDTPVHYQDDNGVWQDYDNTVSADSTSDSQTDDSSADSTSDMAADSAENNTTDNTTDNSTEYKNKKSDKDIRLTDKAKDKSMVSIKSKGNTLSWGYEGIAKSRVEFTNKDNTATEGNDKFLSLPNITQEAWYRDVYQDVDMQYLITSTGIKENIMLKGTDASRDFTINYNIGDLTATQTDDHTIVLANDAGETIYTLSAPIMTDAKGNTSDQVTLSILKNKGKKLTVQMTADSSWLDAAECTYPVKIDPFVYVDKTPQTTDCATLVERNIDLSGYCSGILKIGHESSTFGTVCSVIRMNDLPQLRTGDMITNATFYALQVGYDGISDVQVNVSKVTTSWSKSNLTNNKYLISSGPQHDSTIEDYTIANKSTRWTNGSSVQMANWDITKTVKGWYNGEPNYGLYMWSNNSNSFADYTSNNPYTDYGSSCYPYISISYLNNNGLEDYWTYHSMDAGFNGTAHINDYTGNLVYTEDIFHSTGSLMPADIQLVYNSSKYNQHFRYGASAGWGFQLNISQRIDYAPDSVRANNYKYVYTDADGTERYFRLKEGCKDGDADAKWVDEDGKGETLTEEGGGIVIRDKEGNEYDFCKPEDSGMLFYIKDSDGNELRTVATRPFDGHDYCITNVYDGAGRETKINYELCQNSYTNYMRIKSIVDPDNRTFTFSYADSDENVLVKIGYPDGTYTQFGYEGIGRLDNISSSDGKKVCLGYVSSSGISSTRIASIKEQALNSGSYIDGQSLQFEYGRQVVNTSDYDNSTKITDEKSRSSIYQFDNAGKTVSIQNSDGSMSNVAYTQDAVANTDGTVSSDAVKNNKMTASSSSQKYVRNYLLNPSGESDGDYYYSTWDNSGLTSQSYATDATYMGTRSMKIVHNQPGMTSSSFAQQIFTSNFDNNYATLSVYVKTQDVQATQANGGAGLFIICYDSNGNAVTSWASNIRVTGTHDWQRISLTTGVIPSNITEVRTYFILQDATGTAWFDCGQLEYGNTMSDCNLLDDCSFCRTDRWSTRSFTGSDNYSGNGCISVQGSATASKQVYQYVPVNRAGVCFNILGVATGAFIPVKENDLGRMGAVELEIIYSDGVHEWHRVSFNQATTATQTAYTAVKPTDSSKVISSVGFTFTYRDQANPCSISSAMMTVDETGTTYSYDSKGNLQSSGDNAKRTQTYTFNDANELTDTTNANNESYSLTYDANNAHRLVSAKSQQLNNGYTFSYGDGKGNVTGTTMGSFVSGGTTIDTTKPYMSSSTSYYNPDKNYNYNYVYSITDARGKTSTFDVDTVNGLTNTQTIPMTIRGADTNQTTSYTYNKGTTGNYLLKGVSSTYNGITMSSAYDYYSGNNLLKTITHNNFSYLFYYDVWGKLKTTMVGNRTLSTNDYNSNDGTLQKTTYGNGDYRSFIYDAFDRVTQINTEKGVLANYAYNNEGQLARIMDSAAGINSDYIYDLSGRLVQSDKTDGAVNQQEQYSYDNLNRVTSQMNWLGSDGFAFGYTYGNDNLLKQSAQGGVIFNYKYDNLNRVKTATANYNSTNLMEAYTYINGNGSNATTSLVSSIGYYIGTTPIHQTDYDYDDSGNIKTVSENGGNYLIHYYYDGFNQLVREDNASLYYTKTYDYDAGGNLTAVKRYAYTTGALGTPLSTTSYGYGDSSWHDLMTSYNGQTITYDGIGNPLQYRNGMTMTWQNGRQLATLHQGSNAISYTYGEDGLRTKKTVNGNVSSYRRDDSGRLICYTTPTGTGHAMWFYYNPGSSTPDSIVYDGNRYIYFKNAQGDILGIVDGNGNLAAAYDYDSWGGCAYVYDGNLNVNTDPNFIGNVNPIRYRGYEYDTETELYYLQSRYYDPVTGRFVNADGYISTGTGLLGHNMFAYSNNNPINMKDDGGCRSLANDVGADSEQDMAVSLAAEKEAAAKQAENDSISYYGEHVKDARPSTKEDHENGQARKKRDDGGEKGDARRKQNPNKRHDHNNDTNNSNNKRQIYNYCGAAAGAVLVVVSVASIITILGDDVTGAGVADDGALVPLGKLVWDGAKMVMAAGT